MVDRYNAAQGEKVKLYAYFKHNDVLYDPFSVAAVRILKSDKVTQVAIKVPIKEDVGKYYIEWDIPSDQDTGKYYDKWEYVRVSGGDTYYAYLDFVIYEAGYPTPDTVTSLHDLLPTLRRLLHTGASSQVDEGVANGITKTFTLENCPVKPDSYYIYIDNVLQTEVTDYTLNLDTGVVLFTVAPTDKSIVKAKYHYFYYSDQELTGYLQDAIWRAKLKGYSSYVIDSNFNVTPAMTDGDKLLMCAIAAITIDPDKDIKWRTEEISYSESDSGSERRRFGEDQIDLWITQAKYDPTCGFVLRTFSVNETTNLKGDEFPEHQ